MGELATHLLEAVARTDMFDTVVVASRDLEKAKKRANNVKKPTHIAIKVPLNGSGTSRKTFDPRAQR